MNEPSRNHNQNDDGSAAVQPPGSWLVHQTAVAGIVSAAARFVPIPFVDDLIRDRCRKYVVAKTLGAHGDPLSIQELEPYYRSEGGCLTGCASILVKVPVKLILFPVRKIVTVLTSIRGVPLEIMRMVLLGRTLDRYLQAGKLTKPSQAALMRIAFDEAFARMDFRAIRAAMRDTLKSVDGWKASAIRAIRVSLEHDDGNSDDLPTSSDLERSADRVQKVLSQPETLVLLTEFDRRFDDAMNVG